MRIITDSAADLPAGEFWRRLLSGESAKTSQPAPAADASPRLSPVWARSRSSNPLLSAIGPSIAPHIGPGAYGVTFVEAE